MKSQARSPKSILRLHNVSFKHALLCHQIFGRHPEKLKKIYGIYFHALTIHLAEISRIIAPSSLYCESEERIFSNLRGIGKAVSSRAVTSIRDVGIKFGEFGEYPRQIYQNLAFAKLNPRQKSHFVQSPN